MPEKDLPPDHLRCKRTDGRQWRCSRRALDGLTLCEIHHLQGKHRQKKQKVPDCLKIERSYSKKKNGEKGGVSKLTKMALEVEKRKRCQSEALDEALKRMKLRRGDLQLELIRVFLKRQVEKKKERALKENAIGETKRELPNGVMAISRPLPQNFSYQNGGLDVKLGVDLNLSLFSQRNFRSKNIEPLPIGTMQAFPFAGSATKKKIKRCHWCRACNKPSMVQCLSCKKRFFCADCIKERYFERQEVKVKCPVCNGSCSCRICEKQQCKAINHKGCPRSKRVDKINLLHYLISKILPVLKQVNCDQSTELEVEARVTGNEQSKVQISQANLGFQKLYCWNCKTTIVDYHRSCTKCSYNICLSCLEFCRGSLSEGFKLKSCKKRKTYLSDDELMLKIKKNISRQSYGGISSLSPMSIQKWKANTDGSVSCPSVDAGGCGNSLLDLRCIFPSTWARELEGRAEKLLCSYHLPETADVSLSCSLCKGIDHKADAFKTVQQVSGRIGSNDNYLYYPTIQYLHQESFEHFQKHWGRGHPVIVRNVLKSNSGLCWDPYTMFCSYIENRSSKPCNEDGVDTTNCSDWCEVEIDRKQIFMGSLEKGTHASVRHKTLKLKALFSSGLFQKQFHAHYDEILRALPLPEYINPVSGLLNLAVKLPKELQKTDLGPCIYISYGGPEELMQADFLTKLCYESHDTVNILAYATDIPISQEQITKIENIMKKCKPQDPHDQSAGKSSVERGKSLLQSEDTGELGSSAIAGESVDLPNGISKGPLNSSDSLKGQKLSAEDENMFYDSESDSEASIICCGTIEKSEDTDEYFLAEDVESSCSSENKQRNNSCGALWDVFRRQDVPKLLEYLNRHSNELSNTSYSKNVHPILDQHFFLDAFHKLKLKEEFDIQPWTFEQHPGEAVIIPAGCPYQIRKVKSCVGAVLDFISPENATQCVKLSDEIRLLPMRHKAREKLQEVKKMTLHGINAAIEDICNLMHSEQDGLIQ